MARQTLDEYWSSIAKMVATRSTCCRRRVGAVITNQAGQVLSTGYNGVPSGFPHCTDSPCPGATDEPGNSSNCLAVHAELNAILQLGGKIKEAAVLYTTTTPCFGCAKVIANTPIKRVVCTSKYADQRGVEVLKYRGISLVYANDPSDNT